MSKNYQFMDKKVGIFLPKLGQKSKYFRPDFKNLQL